MNPLSFEMSQVIVLRFDTDMTYIGRVDAPRAVLRDRKWELQDATINLGKKESETVPAYVIPTELNRTTIEESFAAPETISFWELPQFIRTLEATGFPAVRHRLHYQSQAVALCGDGAVRRGLLCGCRGAAAHDDDGVGRRADRLRAVRDDRRDPHLRHLRNHPAGHGGLESGLRQRAAGHRALLHLEDG
nr:LptF/LptG family permease [Azospirillum argentinense]